MDQAGPFTMTPRKLILPFVAVLGGLVILVVALISTSGANDTPAPAPQAPAASVQYYDPCLATPFDCHR
jgi:hypothetical protein